MPSRSPTPRASRLSPPSRARLSIVSGRRYLGGGSDDELWLQLLYMTHRQRVATLDSRYCCTANRPTSDRCPHCGLTVAQLDAEQAANGLLLKQLHYWWPQLLRDATPWRWLRAHLYALHQQASPAPWTVRILADKEILLHAGAWQTKLPPCDAPTFCAVATFAAGYQQLAKDLANARNQLALLYEKYAEGKANASAEASHA